MRSHKDGIRIRRSRLWLAGVVLLIASSLPAPAHCGAVQPIALTNATRSGTSRRLLDDRSRSERWGLRASGRRRRGAQQEIPLDCTWTFDSYESSEVETWWIENVKEFESLPELMDPKFFEKDSTLSYICQVMDWAKPYLDEWLQYIVDAQQDWKERTQDFASIEDLYRAEHRGPFERSTKVMSSFTYRSSCTGATRVRYIEPLFGFLRHPYFPCYRKIKLPGPFHPVRNKDVRKPSLLDKDYLLFDYGDSLNPRQNVYYFDVGCSMYDEGGGGASVKWLVETYASHGVEMDRLAGWEGTVYPPADFWKRIPFKVKSRYSFYNVYASSQPGNADNPIEYIRELTTKDDYVILKIDVDATKIERELVQQLQEDPRLVEIVDEFIWEHHVYGNPLQTGPWKGTLEGQGIPRKGNMLHDSVDLFLDLRRKGIRAHSWV